MVSPAARMVSPAARMVSPAARMVSPAALCLLLAGALAQERWVRPRNEPALSDLFTMDTPHYYRRQDKNAMKDLQKQMKSERVADLFYDPYNHQGDIVFLRTTEAPNAPDKVTSAAGELQFYNNAVITDYRECNLVCPKLYKKSGAVCGWRLFYHNFVQWKTLDRWPYGYYDGKYKTTMYKTFDSLCALQAANCMDHTANVPSNTRPLWRLVHLSPCPEFDEGLEIIWNGPYNQGHNGKYWIEKSEELLKISRAGSYVTRTTNFNLE